MDKGMKSIKKEKDVSARAEEMLKSYADEWADSYAAEAEKLLRDDEQYRRAQAKYGSYRRRSTKKRLLRCAAVLICAIFIASIAVPIPQAHAWRVWWLDLVTTENAQDIDVRANKDYVGEYYVSELPEGFELEAEECSASRKVASYKNAEGKTIIFTQIKDSRGNGHVDSQKTNYKSEMIGEFEVLIGKSDERIIFEMMTENTFIVISTDANYEFGVKFIEGLHKIS